MANGRGTVAEGAARQLANATKTRAQWGGITPRWFIPFMPWTPVEAGIYRLNKVKETRGADIGITDVECSPPRDRDADLPETFVDYGENPARVLPQRGDDRARRATGSPTSTAIPSIRSKSSLPAHREGEGEAGERADQQQEYGLLANGPVHAISHVQRRTDTGRSRRAHRPGWKEPRSSSRIRAPSPPSGASARGVAFRRRP